MSPSASAPPQELVSSLNAWDATAILVGGIIGSGIFIAPALVARQVATPAMALMVWAVAGALACSGALCYAELGAAMPETGGSYKYLRRAYPSALIGFLFGWTFFFVDGTGSIAAIATVFAAYTGQLLHIPARSTVALRLTSAAVIMLLTAVNCFGLRRGALVQKVATILKVAAILGIMGAAAGIGHGTFPSFLPILPPGGYPHGAAAAWTAALVPALFAYSGWTYTSYMAGEMIHPRRDIPRSILAAIAIVLVIYLLVNLADIYLLPFPELQQSLHVASDAAQHAVGPVGGALTAAAVAISTFGALNAVVLIYPRIAFAMARDGLFFQRASRVHARYRTPNTALWLQGIIATAFALSGTYEQILGYFAFVEYLFFALVVAAVIVLRIRAPAMPRPYRVWLYPIPPLLFLGVGVWYMTTLLASQWRQSLVGIALMLTGVPFYFYWRGNTTDRATPEGGATGA